MAIPNKTVVFKLGGSLLDWAEFPGRFLALLEEHRDCRRAIVAGGGGGADWIRKVDDVQHLDRELAHDLAVKIMAINALMVDHILPKTQLASSQSELEQAWENDRTAVVVPGPMLSREAGETFPTLAKDWSTTSDSIAAWFAERLHADELVLIKSTDLDQADTLEKAAVLGLVDPALPGAASRLERVSICNLRAVSPRKRLLRSRTVLHMYLQ